MEHRTHAFESLLRAEKVHITEPRRAVFTYLLSAEPSTMHELVAALPGVDRASIYRTVALYEKLGIIHRVQLGWKYKLELSDRFSPHHHHLSCSKCGRIVAFEEPSKLDSLLASSAAVHGFTVTGHILEVSGTCADCNSKSKK